MLETNRNLATASVTEGETALHVLSRNPSAFVSDNRSCELLLLFFFHVS